MVKLDYKDGRSLHEQIEAELKKMIVNGILEPDEQLPSVREMAISLTVNPNTVQRAYKKLENEGFIYSIKGRGNFVSVAAKAHDEQRIIELYDCLGATLKELMFLGENKSNIENVLEKIFSEREEKQ